MALTTPTSPPGQENSRSRRSQEERRAETRERLLEATVECLAELGWAGTSTTEVARRAGVSRGAQQHHYRTKRELVAAAVEHLLQRQRAEFERAFAELPSRQRNIEGALDLLWSIYRERTFTALLELAVAGRTDETIRRMCADINDRVAQITIETFERLFPVAASREVMPTALRSTLALLAGLALQHGLDDDRHGHQAAVLAQWKTIGRRLVPEAPVDPGGTP